MDDWPNNNKGTFIFCKGNTLSECNPYVFIKDNNHIEYQFKISSGQKSKQTDATVESAWTDYTLVYNADSEKALFY